MSFVQLKKCSQDFRDLMRETTGRDLVADVSVEEPEGSLDELHFVKLVAWAYVFLIEASNPTTRCISNLLRASSPDQFRTFDAVLEDVSCLRTVRAHNLSQASRSDEKKRTRAAIWLMQNGGGEPPDWSASCDALSSQVIQAISVLERRWRAITSSKEDSVGAVERLLQMVDREWPAHEFDRLIESAADALGLQTFDAMRYREMRLKELRNLAGLFEGRQHAERAMSSAIYRDLERTFGMLQVDMDRHELGVSK